MEEEVDRVVREKKRSSPIPLWHTAVAEKVVRLALHFPPDDITYWTSAMMSDVRGISASAGQRIWRGQDLQTRNVKQFTGSGGSKFVAKLRDMMGLHIRLSAIAASVDKTTARSKRWSEPPACLSRRAGRNHDPRLQPQFLSLHRGPQPIT